MPLRKRISVFLDPELLDGLKAMKVRTLAPEAATIRQAVKEYLERHGVSMKAERKRAVTRTRTVRDVRPPKGGR